MGVNKLQGPVKLYQLIHSLNLRLCEKYRSQVSGEFQTTSDKQSLPSISVGDTVRVLLYIQEGNKERLQPYEGVVIAQHKAGINTTITVRKIFQGVGVERVFAVYSPSLNSIQIVRRAAVRRAKLYYLRNRVGKGTRLSRSKALLS